MRGGDRIQSAMFSYLSPETRVRKEHPLRAIRGMVDSALGEMSPLFDDMYSELGRPSIAPEKLLRAQLLQMLYSVRSERLLMEEIDYSVLFRWFVGMNMDEPVWDATVFTKNRDRLLEHNVAKVFFAQVWQQAEQANLIPDDPSNPTVNFHGEERSNDTHASNTDPDAQLARKGGGKEAKLSYCGNLLIENGNGLIANTELLQANGTAERDAALLMIEQIPAEKRVTVGADKGYDTRGFVAECRQLNATPHVSQNAKRPGGSAIDARTTRHAGYNISQQKRKRIEECFGWLKTIALLRKLRHRGIFKVGWIFTFAAAAYNLVRMRKLLAPVVPSA